MPPSIPNPSLARVLPTRVRRNYRGGRLLDRLEGLAKPADTDRPENWIASTTPACNPGLPAESGEGLTRLELPDGKQTTLAALIATAPAFYLGADHFARHGTELGFLAKLLDSAMRLHVQAHPTAEFARAHLGSPYGKLEVYYVLDVRTGVRGEIRLGFQHSPGREGWRRIVAEQDMLGMDTCFEPIAVEPGDAWIVPGGTPHAIGEGVLMVEIMEPSDLVVRCEFERDGIVVPPAGRFMERGLDFCLDIFDYTSRPPAEIRARCQLRPILLAEGSGWVRDQLVGPQQTRCFEIQRVRAVSACAVPNPGRAALVIQTRGSGQVAVSDRRIHLRTGDSAFIAAAADTFTLDPGGGAAEWLICRPAPAHHARD